MKKLDLKVKVGDGVVISPPSSPRSSPAPASPAPAMERLSTVSAVRAKSFDAGGLCFRNDGKEWRGYQRVRLISQPLDVMENRVAPELSEDEKRRDDERQVKRAKRSTENAILAYLLSYRQENEWLNLSLHELRRIAALHGITLQKRPRSKRQVLVPIR
jgi:hypothetical protein